MTPLTEEQIEKAAGRAQLLNREVSRLVPESIDVDAYAVGYMCASRLTAWKSIGAVRVVQRFAEGFAHAQRDAHTHGDGEHASFVWEWLCGALDAARRQA